MMTRRWLIAFPLAALMIGSTALGSAVRDEGRMFSPRAVEDAEHRLDRLEKKTHVPVVIETIDHLPNMEGASEAAKREALTRLAVERDEKIRDPGMYILISKRDRLIGEPLIREHLKDSVTLEKRHAIRKAIMDEFQKKDFDGGLLRGVEEIERTLEGVSSPTHRAGARAGAPVPVGQGARRGPVGGGGSMMGTFLMIGLGIFAVLIILRLLGALFGRSQGAGYPGQMGMGGPRPGMGPGYGGGGYGGGGGGGFFSGLLGGLGGAMAGNWLYDQMSGRHGGGMTSAGAGLPGEEGTTSPTDAADERIIGADDDGGQAASWGDGGADTGGGDWGGGDAGGGDWGGGGGDWGGGDGGGGGDWGGGGGGGDW